VKVGVMEFGLCHTVIYYGDVRSEITSSLCVSMRWTGSAMLLSSVLMLLISVNKCYYRQATDVGATESSSSIGRASQLSSDTPPTSEQQLVV